MKNIYHFCGTLIVFTFVMLSTPAWADLQSDLTKCRALEDAPARLTCYDAINLKIGLEKTQQSSPQMPVQAVAPEKPATPKASAQVATVPPIDVTAKIQSANQSNQASNDDHFGNPKDYGPDSIESHIVGEFKGWVKGMKIKLKNGQIWRVTSQNAGYRRMNNPKITISKGFFGSFSAKVDGLNAKAKVKRIK